MKSSISLKTLRRMLDEKRAKLKAFRLNMLHIKSKGFLKQAELQVAMLELSIKGFEEEIQSREKQYEFDRSHSS